MAKEDIMKDVVDISREELQAFTDLYRQESYIRAAAEKRQTISLNGGISARVGGIIELQQLDRRTADRIEQNMRRAIEWMDVAGFVPFSVDPPEHCDETGGAAIGFGSDEAAEISGGSGNGGVAGYGPSYWSSQHWGEDTAGDLGETTEEQQPQTRPPLSSVESSDFDFMVPSLGIGEYKVYRDVRDNKRRVVYNDPDAEMDTADSASPNDSDSEAAAAAAARNPGPIWYVYTVEEPHSDGSPNSPVGRLYPRYKYLLALEKMELSGAQLGYSPVAITQPTPVGRGLRNLDHHVGFSTDLDTVQISGKDAQGMPPGFKDMLRERDETMRSILQFNGINPDDGIREATQDGSRRLPKMNIEERRQLASLAKPSKIFDVHDKEKEYIGRVAIEFGVPLSDLSEVGAHFKPERGKQSVSLIEKGRRVRSILTDLLYNVFDIRNASRMKQRFMESLSGARTYKKDLEAVIRETKKLIERARKEAVVVRHQAESGDKPEPEAADSASAPEAAKESGPSQEEPPNKEDDSPTRLPSVEDLVAYVQQVESSYSHIGRVQMAIESMLNDDRLMTISWKHPLVADASQLDETASALQLDEAQKAEMARFYYGLKT